MEACWLCEINPISSKIKPLCHFCYSACRIKGLLHIFPSLHSNENSKASAIQKYGMSLQDNMDILSNGRSTLDIVGKKYGITRERVRQLYYIFFGEKYSSVVSKKIESNKAIREENAGKHSVEVQERKKIRLRLREEKIEEFQDFDNRLNRIKKNCTTYIGIIAEHLFREKCKSFGYEVEMQKGGHVFDAKVNGIAVDVKSRTTAVIYSNSNKQPYYYFHSKEKQRNKIKFLALYLQDEDSWYILPSSIVKGRRVSIPKYDVPGHGCHRYRDLQQYREAWHLLKGQAYEGQQGL